MLWIEIGERDEGGRETSNQDANWNELASSDSIAYHQLIKKSKQADILQSK